MCRGTPHIHTCLRSVGDVGLELLAVNSGGEAVGMASLVLVWTALGDHHDPPGSEAHGRVF